MFAFTFIFIFLINAPLHIHYIQNSTYKTVPDPCEPSISPQETLMDVCPVCRTDAFLNPAIKFLISPCFHWLCDGCVKRLFAHGSAPCPTCGVICRRTAYTLPTFLDVRVEKEVKARRLGLAVGYSLNKHDYKTAREYEDACEWFEWQVQRMTDAPDGSQMQVILEEIKERAVSFGSQVVDTGLITEHVNDVDDTVVDGSNNDDDDATEMTRDRKRIKLSQVQTFLPVNKHLEETKGALDILFKKTNRLLGFLVF